MKLIPPACALAASLLFAGCTSNGNADRYAPPPNDGSAPANSSDVVDNPSITTGSPNAWDKQTLNSTPNDGSVPANSADVVDNPPIVAASAASADRIQGADVVDRPTQVDSATAMKGYKYIDPISREPIVGEGHVGYYGMWQVRFQNGENAKQFVSLPKAKRAVLAAPQVLAQKGITNTTCPLTGETLTAAAAPVKYEGAVIGFASVADANQFRALNKEAQAKLITKWKALPKP